MCMSLVELISEKDLTGCQNIYDYVGKESYNVLKLTTSDKELLDLSIHGV